MLDNRILSIIIKNLKMFRCQNNNMLTAAVIVISVLRFLKSWFYIKRMGISSLEFE